MEVNKKQTLGELTKEQLISELRKLGVIKNNTFMWEDLCQKTEFETFVTALAYGLSWDSNVDELPKGHLKMALYNIIKYPKRETSRGEY